jgi:hypothetical protein
MSVVIGVKPAPIFRAKQDLCERAGKRGVKLKYHSSSSRTGPKTCGNGSTKIHFLKDVRNYSTTGQADSFCFEFDWNINGNICSRPYPLADLNSLIGCNKECPSNFTPQETRKKYREIVCAKDFKWLTQVGTLAHEDTNARKDKILPNCAPSEIKKIASFCGPNSTLETSTEQACAAQAKNRNSESAMNREPATKPGTSPKNGSPKKANAPSGTTAANTTSVSSSSNTASSSSNASTPPPTQTPSPQCENNTPQKCTQTTNTTDKTKETTEIEFLDKDGDQKFDEPRGKNGTFPNGNRGTNGKDIVISETKKVEGKEVSKTLFDESGNSYHKDFTSGAVVYKNAKGTEIQMTGDGSRTSSKENKLEVKNQLNGLDEDCGISSRLTNSQGQFMGCRGTKQLVEGAKVFDQASQMIGSTAVNVAGQSAYQQSIQSGKQADIYEGASKTMKTSGYTSLGVGAANLLLGGAQMRKEYQHRDNAKSFSQVKTESNQLKIRAKGANGGDDLTADQYLTKAEGNGFQVEVHNLKDGSLSKKVVEEFGVARHGTTLTGVKGGESFDISLIQTTNAEHLEELKATRRKEVDHREGEIKAKVDEFATTGQREQTAAREMARAGAQISMLKGAVQTINALAQLKQAREMEKIAKKQKKIDNQYQAPIIISGDGFTPGTTQGGQNTSPSTGTQGPDQFNVASDEKEDDTSLPPPEPPLGGGALDDRVAQGIPPGAFEKGDAGGGAPGAAGGAGGFGGGGGTPAASAEGNENPQAKALDSGKAENKYTGAGGAGGTYRGGGGGGAGGKSDSGGLDFAGLLKQFLPGEEKKEEAAPPSILDYAGASRGLASEEDPGLALDRGRDIFSRVSQKYSDKLKQGDVGE